MKELTEEQMQAGIVHFQEAVEVSNEIYRLLESSNVDIAIATMAMGIGFASSAAVINMPLPAAIDLVRGVYKQTQNKSKAH